MLCIHKVLVFWKGEGGGQRRRDTSYTKYQILNIKHKYKMNTNIDVMHYESKYFTSAEGLGES